VIYLDNAAMSFPKPESVYRAMDRCAREQLANPGRSGHRMAIAAERILEDCRHRLNQLFHGASAERWALTFNCTDALNMAIKGVLRPGDHVVTTDLEHNSVSRPLVALEKAGVITLTRVQHDGQGSVEPDAIRKAMTPQTRLVAVSHASNVLGTVQPVRDYSRIVRDSKAFLLVDAAQTAGVLPIDVQADNIDLFACPGHKALFGPSGTGALYVSPRVPMKPWREGGTGGDSLSPTQPEDYPFYLEGGTPNVLGIAGLIAGLAFVEEKGLANIHRHETALLERLRPTLMQLGCEVFGHADTARRVGTLSFRHTMLPAAEIGGILDQSFDIAVRPGLHCAPYVHHSLGTVPDGLLRVSAGPFNTEADIDQLASALGEILEAH
jgi:cysteine desulfurase / selenocysteine lyase